MPWLALVEINPAITERLLEEIRGNKISSPFPE
jgi:hypothetical protein